MEAIVRMFTPSKGPATDDGARQNAAAAAMPMPEAPKAADAAATAEETIKKKKRIIAQSSKSVYTSPLGIGGEASVIKKTLLGQ